VTEEVLVPKDWSARVQQRGGKLYVEFKENGRWVQRVTPCKVGEEKAAESIARKIERELKEREAFADETGIVTVRSFGEKWLERRKRLPSWQDDESHLKHHIYPRFGGSLLVEVKPKMVRKMMDELELAGLAPRTRRNIYSTGRSLFRAAQFEELIVASPFILSREDMPKPRDVDPRWRKTAIFLPTEVEQLISDASVPQDRRVIYALLFLGCARFGEMAALRWRHIEARVPLACLEISASYNVRSKKEKGVKAGPGREVPVHPTLAKVLAAWKLTGWKEMFGQDPKPDDLIAPSRKGKNRSVNHGLKKFHEDLERLELRVRRQHDSRRTFATLAENACRDREAVKWIVHGRAGDVLSQYTDAEWDRLCAAVLSVKIELREGRVLALGPTPNLLQSPASVS
jgi:integrase